MRSGLVVLCFCLAAAAWPSTVHGCSQCLCGTPFHSDVLGGVVPNQYRYGLEERFLSKANGLEDGPGTEREREHRLSAFGLWRPFDRVAFLGRLPWNAKEITEEPAGEAAATSRQAGLGDAEVQVLVGLAQAGAEPRAQRASLGLVIGVQLPTGFHEQANDAGERLDEHLQPGSGAWSGSAGLQYGLVTAHGAFDASVIARANGTNEHGYRYGNALLFNAGYATPVRRGWAVVAQLNGRAARRDRSDANAEGANTGGSVVYAAPGLRWRGASGLGLDAAVQVPLAQALDGEQTEHTTARVGLSLGR